MKPFLILQLRPVNLASDDEFSAYLKYGGLKEHEVHRVRMEKESIPEINLDDYSGIIIGGGPSNISDDEEKKPDYQKRFEKELMSLLDNVFKEDFPILGNCYGIGALVKYQGGEVSKEKYSEDLGAVEIKLTEAGQHDELLIGLPANFIAYGGHNEACQKLPNSAILLASSDNCPIQMIRFGKNMYATQFHTELDADGTLLRIDIYKDQGYFSPEDIETVKKNTKDHHVTFPFKILSKFIQKYKLEY